MILKMFCFFNFCFKFLKGLLDATNAEEFMTKLSVFEDVWNTREQPYLNSSQAPVFYEYISNKVLPFCHIISS